MSSYWPIKKRRRRRTDWDQIHRLATVGGRTLRELSDEYHIPYGTLCNRAWRERWMIARIHSNSRAAAQARTSASQEQYNQLASQAALDTQNGSQATRTPNSPPSQATGSSGAIMTPETIASSLDPESVRLSLLASINYFARLALQTIGLQSESRRLDNCLPRRQPALSRSFPFRWHPPGIQAAIGYHSLYPD